MADRIATDPAHDTLIPAWIAAANAYDAEAFLRFFAEDAVLEDPGVGTFEGRAGIAEYFASYFVAYRTRTRLVAVEPRGTEVHVRMDYIPPAGRFGHLIASLLGNNPKRVVREDLRNFKRLMEIGEIPTIIGQSHGTCTGQGKPYTENQWRPLFT